MSYRIAVIDDHRPILQLLQVILEEEGHAVLALAETQTAHELLTAFAPDVVILDLHVGVPGAGAGLLEILRSDPVLAHMPVIICSADPQALQERAGRLAQLGCWTLEKPFLLNDLFAQLQTVLAARPEARAHAGAPQSANHSPSGFSYVVTPE